MKSEDYKISIIRRLGEPSARIGLLGWFGLYLTGALLLIFLFAHLWLVHYVLPQPITLKHTIGILGSPFIKVVDLGLLLLAVIHGMTGLGRLILDLELIKRKGGLILNVILFSLGLIIFFEGVYIFKFFV